MDAVKSFIETQNETSYQNMEEDLNNKSKRKEICQHLFRDRQRCLMFIFFILFALTIPLIIYFIITNTTFEVDITYSCAVEAPYRIPCGNPNITTVDCIAIHGCYDDFTTQCYHFIPSKYNYYEDTNNVFQSLQSNSPFQSDTISHLKLSLLEIDGERLKIILHTPTSTYNNHIVTNKNYYTKTGGQLLGVEVFRNSTNEMILTTLRGPLIASNHYWEWTVQLISEKLFGLGELVYKENVTVSKIIYKNKYDHNTLPNFMCYLNGSFYAVRFEHDGPLEVTVLPSKVVILKSLAGERITINIYMGPTPRDIIQQQRLEKSEVPLLPYWTLGAHLCRDGNTTLDSAIEEFLEFYELQKDVQYASDCIHENLYIMLDQENEDHKLTDLIKKLQESSHFVMSMPPQISKLNKNIYNSAVELDVLYKTVDGKHLDGFYRNHDVVFPDFNNTSIDKWFEQLKLNLPSFTIDGFVLKDNWPEEENYIFQDQLYEFPYMTEGLNASLSKTIPWNLTISSSSLNPHIMEHNVYGKYHVKAYKDYMQYEFLMTSSYDYEETEGCLIQNVDISWSNLKKAIVTTLYNSILGNSIISTPVCGSTDKYNNITNEDICLRWYIMAASLPIFRISSDFPRRDPTHLITGFAKNSALDALRKRYMILPYYYTILSSGDPLVRPMFYTFHTDNNTWDLDEQYMLGNALLIAQPVLPALTSLEIYLPIEIEVWYEFWGGYPYVNKGWLTLNIVKNDWVMFIAEGYIVPLRHYTSTTIGKHSPSDSFGFAVALNCSVEECFSEGFLYVDSANITVTANKTGITVGNIPEAKNGIGCDLSEPNHPRYIDSVNIYGLQDTLLQSNFSLIDICTINEQEIFIPYFKIV